VLIITFRIVLNVGSAKNTETNDSEILSSASRRAHKISGGTLHISFLRIATRSDHHHFFRVPTVLPRKPMSVLSTRGAPMDNMRSKHLRGTIIVVFPCIQRYYLLRGVTLKAVEQGEVLQQGTYFF